jgi:hypothetical protein
VTGIRSSAKLGWAEKTLVSISLVEFITNFGPSGVRALPLAAGRNEGGHYYQAQLKL